MTRSSHLLILLICIAPSLIFAQAETKVERLPPVKGLVENMFFMPYITGNYNMHSGKAFPKSASGMGYGFGVAIDLTKDGQKSGFYFDIAFQDMRAATEDGIYMNDEFDTLLTSERAEHYYQYVLLEPFVKLQGERANGYFLLGASLGYAVKASLIKAGDVRQEYSNWATQEFHNPFRLDIRAGLGLILANTGAQKLILEARIGYPVTNALSDFLYFFNDEGIAGNWRIISLQANLGLRF
jgi:hypothetical protein